MDAWFKEGHLKEHQWTSALLESFDVRRNVSRRGPGKRPMVRTNNNDKKNNERRNNKKKD